MRSWASPVISFFFSPLPIFGPSKKKRRLKPTGKAHQVLFRLPFSGMLHTPCHMPTIRSTIGGGIMPVHNALGGRHIWHKKSNPTLPRRCHKLSGQKSPFVTPPALGLGGLIRPSPLTVQFSARLGSNSQPPSYTLQPLQDLPMWTLLLG